MATRNQRELIQEFFRSSGGLRRPLHFTWGSHEMIDRELRQLNYVVEGQRIPIARFISKTTLLLNGEGMRNNGAQFIQTQVRNAAQAQVNGLNRPLIIPYAALDSAGVVYET